MEYAIGLAIGITAGFLVGYGSGRSFGKKELIEAFRKNFVLNHLSVKKNNGAEFSFDELKKSSEVYLKTDEKKLQRLITYSLSFLFILSIIFLYFIN
ncbi:MAG: hypothetical protein Kow0098_18300 [Ignavibacteriaceae bacterium]